MLEIRTQTAKWSAAGDMSAAATPENLIRQEVVMSPPKPATDLFPLCAR